MTKMAAIGPDELEFNSELIEQVKRIHEELNKLSRDHCFGVLLMVKLRRTRGRIDFSRANADWPYFIQQVLDMDNEASLSLDVYGIFGRHHIPLRTLAIDKRQFLEGGYSTARMVVLLCYMAWGATNGVKLPGQKSLGNEIKAASGDLSKYFNEEKFFKPLLSHIQVRGLFTKLRAAIQNSLPASLKQDRSNLKMVDYILHESTFNGTIIVKPMEEEE